MKQEILSKFVKIKSNVNFEALVRRALAQHLGTRYNDIIICEMIVCKKCGRIGYVIAKTIERKRQKKIVGIGNLKYCIVLKRVNVLEKIVDMGFRIANDGEIILDRGITSLLFLDETCCFCRDEKSNHYHDD